MQSVQNKICEININIASNAYGIKLIHLGNGKQWHDIQLYI